MPGRQDKVIIVTSADGTGITGTDVPVPAVNPAG